MTQSDDILLAEILDELHELRDSLPAAEVRWGSRIDLVGKPNIASARNLVHYWALRQRDLRRLQERLSTLGLSSLGRSEPHVQATLEVIVRAAEALLGHSHLSRDPVVGFDEGAGKLRRHAVGLFGPEPADRPTRIMVTLASEAATDPALVRSLVERGMDLARINCAHDEPDSWTAMIDNVRAANVATGRHCRIAMDLAGPKLRTGPLEMGPRVIKLRPTRDAMGRVVDPARCWLTAQEEPSPAPRPELATLPVPGVWLACLKVGDTISCTDARGSRRRLVVVAVHPDGALIRTERTAYVATGTVLRAPDGRRARVGGLAPTEQYLTLRRGDTLTLNRDCAPAIVLPQGPASIGCTLPEAFGQVAAGDRVHLDDGKMSGTVLDSSAEHITIRITAAAVNGSRLRAAKGINLPDTVLPIPALTDTDRANLAFAAEHADLVELSFVRTPQDVEDLLSALEGLGADRLGIVIKVETAQGFANLPAILLVAMRRAHAGVMIARGDLAAECGYERLAELQEEILWLCEAAHLPVIWATQVLDQLARSGLPSRAEITDAAMGERAECVMLNKGPHIVEAVASLDDILCRMATHHYKKNALLRPLRSWRSKVPMAILPEIGPSDDEPSLAGVGVDATPVVASDEVSR